MSYPVDLEEVGTFIRVVDAGSMRLAAERLGVPRSTVSRRIARLESMLDVTLLSRTTRKMALTPHGAAFYERVAPAVRAVADAADVVRSLDGAPRGLLRVTAPVDLSLSIIPDIVSGFTARYPEIRVHVEVTNHVVDLVGEGFDLAVRGGPLADSSLVVRRISAVDYWLVASPAYLRKHRAPREPSDLAEHDCLLFRPSGDRVVWQLERADETLDVEVTGRISASDFGFLRQSAISGAGVALLPAIATAAEIRAGRLARVLEPWVKRGAPMSIVTPPGKHMPAKVRAFSEYFVERIHSDCKEKHPLRRVREA